MPYTGFWPDYYTRIQKEFLLRYNISLERKWYTTSSALLHSITNGETNFTEPYMLVGASHGDISRKSAFRNVVYYSATQSMYFTKASSSSSKNNLNFVKQAIFSNMYFWVSWYCFFVL